MQCNIILMKFRKNYTKLKRSFSVRFYLLNFLQINFYFIYTNHWPSFVKHFSVPFFTTSLHNIVYLYYLDLNNYNFSVLFTNVFFFVKLFFTFPKLLTPGMGNERIQYFCYLRVNWKYTLSIFTITPFISLGNQLFLLTLLLCLLMFLFFYKHVLTITFVLHILFVFIVPIVWVLKEC